MLKNNKFRECLFFEFGVISKYLNEIKAKIDNAEGFPEENAEMAASTATCTI